MRVPSVRSAIRPMMRVALITGFLGIAYDLVLYPFVVHQRWYRAIEYRILCLAERRPGDVDSKQWAACLHWTWNLHGNYGGLSYFDPRARYLFLAEFDRRLEGKVDFSTIDWIWDQYALHTKGGSSYSDRYRPTTAVRLKEASLDRYGENHLDSWLEQLKRRRSGDE
jgi:hypothetical protein